MLGCALVACSDRPSIVEPRATAPALQQSGPPTPVEPGQFEDEISSEICGFPYLVEATGKLKTLDLPGWRTIVTAHHYRRRWLSRISAQAREANAAWMSTPRSPRGSKGSDSFGRWNHSDGC